MQAQQLIKLLQVDKGMLLVDVRPREQFDIAHIPGALPSIGCGLTIYKRHGPFSITMLRCFEKCLSRLHWLFRQD